MMMIMVRPIGRGRFQASLDGRVIVKSSRQPFLAAARILAGEGVDPGTEITMRHVGHDHDALTSTVGKAAALTVNESGGTPRFGRWNLLPVLVKD